MLFVTFYLRTNLHPGVLYRNWYDHVAAYTQIVSKNSQYQWAQHSSKYKLAESIHVLSSFILFNRTDYRFHSSFELSNYRFVYIVPVGTTNYRFLETTHFALLVKGPEYNPRRLHHFVSFWGTVKYNTNNFVIISSPIKHNVCLATFTDFHKRAYKWQAENGLTPYSGLPQYIHL